MTDKARRYLSYFSATGKQLPLALSVYAILVVFSPDFVVGSFESHAIEFRLSDLFFLGLLGYLAYSAVKKDRKLFYPSIFPAGLLYVMSFFLGALVSFIKRGGSLGLEATFFAVKYLEYFLIFFVTANLIRTEKQINYLLKWLIGLLTVSAILLTTSRFVSSLYLTLTIKLPSFVPEFHHLGSRRATLPFAKGFGPSAEFLVILIPFALFFFVNSGHKGEKMLYLLSTVLLSAGLLFTGSRGPIAALFVSVVLLIPIIERRLIPWLAAGGVGVGALYFLVPFVQGKIDSILVIFSDGVCSNNSMCVRVTRIWPEGLGYFFENPVLGGGLASFPTSDTQYIRLLADQGIIGLGVFVIFVGSLLFYLTRFRKESLQGWKTGVYGAMMVSTVALLINGITATAFEPVRAMEPFWFLLGLVFAFEKFDNSDRKVLSAGG
ncbi:MAG: O-antigen ligase family protein [Candidatus Bipolaricaulota bacterium]